MKYKISGFICLTISSFTLAVTLFSIEPATITGDKMKILSKGDIMEFIGHVKLIQDNLEITSDNMKSNNKTDVVSARGNVYVHYSSGTSNTYAWSEEAEYNKNDGSGVFSVNVKTKRYLSDNTTDFINLTCDRLELSKTDVVSAKGNVYIHYSSGTSNTYAWSEEAEYNKNDGSGVFSVNVKVKRFLSESTTDFVNLTCDKLELFDFGKKLHAVKNVKISQAATETQSNEAFYDRKSNEILLLGGPPKITRTEDTGYSEYSGDKITMLLGRETVEILGNVKTKMIVK